MIESHPVDASSAPPRPTSADGRVRINLEIVAYVLLITATIFTRFSSLGTRVMSHDESLHTQFSWYLAEGRGFKHDPLMHGPLQFHLVALSYFLFGDSDASARVPAAVSGVLSVLLVIAFRRWLGRSGTFVAAFMMAFSPYMLYYSRYVRNEALIVPIALAMFYSVFRYFETRESKWLYLFAAMLALHFTAKETSFIYTAQLLIFLGAVFAWRMLRMPWRESNHKITFAFGLGAASLGFVTAVVSLFRERAAAASLAGEVGIPANPTAPAIGAGVAFSPVIAFGLILGVLGLLLMLTGLVLSFGKRLRQDFPSLDLLVVALTMTLPQLAALPANLLGWDPLEYTSIGPLNRTIMMVAFLLVISAAIGLLWNRRKWLVAAGVFFGIFIVFYTTFFTNQDGIASGFVGSLGYWLEQHGVERGGQPWYYYIFLQVPLYEYLAAAGSLFAFVYWWRIRPVPHHDQDLGEVHAARGFPVIGFLAYWTITSLAAYTFAGERMPWLTVHIALPMILFGGWGFGQFLERIDWPSLKRERGWLAPLVLILAFVAIVRALALLFGDSPPFQGSELEQLRATNGFLTAVAFSVGGLIAVYWLARRSARGGLLRFSLAIPIFALAILSVRTALRASFINYDRATEYLVYAHSATGVKTAMKQIEDLSVRMTDGLGIKVAYDDDVSWPLNWYLRDYPNQFYFGANPTRELLNYPVILVGDNNWQLVEPLLADRYFSFEYIRMWWPNQDYWALKWNTIEGERNRDADLAAGQPSEMTTGEYLRRVWQDHLKPFFTDASVRKAIWEIWLNRDFSLYGAVTNKDMSLAHWSPSDRMRLYIRKDIATQVWDYGVTPADVGQPELQDPYADRLLPLRADLIVGHEGAGPGQFATPRDVAVGPDGTIYVVDSMNHRIQRFGADGTPIGMWGTFANVASEAAPGGTFNEPWGIDVASDGTVYVADTWNHRIQWFTPEGRFLGMFGTEGIGEGGDIFWGPRDVAVDDVGRIFVADTGNKYIKVYDAQGAFLTEFGGGGYLAGNLDEPVGIAIDKAGRIYVADTWNQRVQVFEETATNTFTPVIEWSVSAWYGQSLNNKPYLDVSADGVVCLTDPEGFRVLCFNAAGEYLLGWGGTYGDDEASFVLLNGVAFDHEGGVWVVDGGNHRLMRFHPDFTGEGS